MSLQQYGIYNGFNSNFITQNGSFTSSNIITFKVEGATLSYISDISNLVLNNSTEFNLRPVIKNFFGYDTNPTIINFTPCTNSVTQFFNVAVNKIGNTYSKVSYGSYIFLNANIDEIDYLNFSASDFQMSSTASQFLNLHPTIKSIQSNENETLSFIQNLGVALDSAEYTFYNNNLCVHTYSLPFTLVQSVAQTLSYTYSNDSYTASGTTDVISNTEQLRLDIPSGTLNIASFSNTTFDEYRVKLKGLLYTTNVVTAASDGDFDTLTDVTLTDYVFGSPVTDGWTYSLSTTQKQNTSRSLFLNGNNASINNFLEISIPLTLSPNTNYKVSYWYYADATALNATFYDHSSIVTDLTDFDINILQPVPTIFYTSDQLPRQYWTKVEGLISTNGAPTSGNLKLYVQQNYETESTIYGNLYIDNLKVESGGSVQDVSEQRIYKINNICSKYDLQRVVWTNKLGGTEYYTMKKIDEKTSVKKDNFYKALDSRYTASDRGQTTYFIQTQKEYKLNTDWIDKAQDEFIQSIFTSPNVYFQIDGDLIPVVLVDSNFKSRVKGVDKMFNYELTFNNSIKNNSNV